jgi:polyisoprenoid-binding protein YceI
MKIWGLVFFILFLSSTCLAQRRLYTKTGSITFFSKTAVENIQARNNKVFSIWDIASSRIEFSVLMKGFEFEKALMQEHFNENYIESDKYPKATFRGVIEDGNTITLGIDKSYNLKVTGALTMHGITKQISTLATIKVNKGVVSASTNFSVLLSDYNIKVPALVTDNINKKIDISVNIPAFIAQQ